MSFSQVSTKNMHCKFFSVIRSLIKKDLLLSDLTFSRAVFIVFVMGGEAGLGWATIGLRLLSVTERAEYFFLSLFVVITGISHVIGMN